MIEEIQEFIYTFPNQDKTSVVKSVSVRVIAKDRNEADSKYLADLAKFLDNPFEFTTIVNVIIGPKGYRQV